MSNADRIEELRSKYEENPRRYFAPLANEYRKAGDLAQAIAICREHLPKQPGHMSGYIVYGQTLFEANNLNEARSVFEQALTLDPENLIALKHLGDIARMNGENGVARRWYARVLDADPRNDDIASQLASLGAPTPAVPVMAVPARPVYAEPPLDEAVGVFATFDPSTLPEIPSESSASASADTWSAPEAVSSVAQNHEPLDLDFLDSPEPDSDEAFEEGIVAPEWPDTTELVARIVTPLRSATPISVPATPDAIEAFGREASDDVAHTAEEIAPQDELVEAFLPSEPVTSSAARDESATLDISLLDAPESHEDELPVIESIADPVVESFADPIVENIADPVAIVAAESDLIEFAPSDFEATAFEPISFDEPALAEDAASVKAAARVENDEPAASGTIDIGNFSEPLSVATFEMISDVDEVEIPTASFEFSEVDSASANVPEAVDSTNDVASPGIEWAEPESVPHSETEDLAFAAELPFEPESDHSSVDQGDTAEFAVPTFAMSVVDESEVAASVADEFFSEDSIETSFADVSVESAQSDEPIEESFAEVSSEQSFAEISSELESEREAAEPSPVVEVAASESEKAQPFVTETMAELLVSQGFHSRAIEVYEELVRRRPHDPVLSARLTELREFEQAEVSRAASTPTPRYTTPMRNTPVYSASQFNSPVQHTPAYVTPLYNTPLSATPIVVPALPDNIAMPSNTSERHNTERLQAFRTARERFAELSRRRVARRTPTHATAIADEPADGLASLFGTTAPATTDELAARALADAFGPVQDSGESLFDPAPTPTPAMPMRALTPRANNVIQPVAATSESRSDRQPSADYSFDKFFPDPAMAGREGQTWPASATSNPSPAQPVNEDLAQFSAWLKGLNNA